MKRVFLMATALLILGSLAGCGAREDEATRAYKGPGQPKAGAPSANPGVGPTQGR